MEGGSTLKLTGAEQRELSQLLNELPEHEICLQMKEYTHHGSITTYDHARAVTELCFLLNRRLHLQAKERELVCGAFLHDLYLYDWHEKAAEHKWHGFHHADKALENAARHFSLTATERRMIYCHMWPLNIRRIPDCREALILCLCDKYCALLETLLHR